MTWQSPVVSIPTMNVIPLVHISPTFVHFVFFTFHVSGPNLFFLLCIFDDTVVIVLYRSAIALACFPL